MRTATKLLWALGALLLAGLAFGVSATATAQDTSPPIPDHADIEEYAGPETCLACHLNAGKEVAESLHYQNLSPAPCLVGAEEDKNYGMLNTY